MLPVEIEERVLDYLCNDVITLRACCLACWSWVPRARLHLFKDVKLHSRKSCLRFLDTLESTSQSDKSPGVGGLVRELRLPAMSLHRAGTRTKVGLRFDLLYRILRYLPHIEILNTDLFDWGGFMVQLLERSGDSLIAPKIFASVFDFPLLTTLCLRNIAVRSRAEVSGFVCSFPAVERLVLDSLSTSDSDSALHPLRAFQDETRTIRILELDVNSRFCYDRVARVVLEDLRQAPFELCLERLKWKSGDPIDTPASNRSMVPVITDIFHDAASTLQELDISLIHEGAGESDMSLHEITMDSLTVRLIAWLNVADFSQHRSLTSLTIKLHFILSGPNYWSSLPGVISQLNSPVLRDLKLCFEIHHGSRWGFLDWPEMARSLVSLHPKCPTVTVTFAFQYRYTTPEVSVVTEHLKSLMGDAIDSGIHIVVLHTSSSETCEWKTSRYPSGGRPSLCTTYTYKAERTTYTCLSHGDSSNCIAG